MVPLLPPPSSSRPILLPRRSYRQPPPGPPKICDLPPRHPSSKRHTPPLPFQPSIPSQSIDRARARVRPEFSYRDAILSPSGTYPPRNTAFSPPSFAPRSSLPLHPPKSLLNPSLRGRCFRCFERGHVAACCREPRRCLLCMRFGHPALRCRMRQAPHLRQAPRLRNLEPNPRLHGREPGPSNDRPSSAAVFLPPRPPLVGVPSISACMARVILPASHPANVDEVLARGLAARFGGSSSNFLVAVFLPPARAVFFPN